MRKTLHVQEIGMKVKAEKNEEGWHIEISPEFAKELESMEPEQREEVLDLIQGLKEGSVDPLSMGVSLCGYCGDEMDHVREGDGPNACNKCLKELR